jgi:hypothetical protein
MNFNVHYIKLSSLHPWITTSPSSSRCKNNEINSHRNIHNNYKLVKSRGCGWNIIFSVFGGWQDCGLLFPFAHVFQCFLTSRQPCLEFVLFALARETPQTLTNRQPFCQHSIHSARRRLQFPKIIRYWPAFSSIFQLSTRLAPCLPCTAYINSRVPSPPKTSRSFSALLREN